MCAGMKNILAFCRISFEDTLSGNPCRADFKAVWLQKDEVSIGPNLWWEFNTVSTWGSYIEGSLPLLNTKSSSWVKGGNFKGFDQAASGVPAARREVGRTKTVVTNNYLEGWRG